MTDPRPHRLELHPAGGPGTIPGPVLVAAVAIAVVPPALMVVFSLLGVVDPPLTGMGLAGLAVVGLCWAAYRRGGFEGAARLFLPTLVLLCFAMQLLRDDGLAPGICLAAVVLAGLVLGGRWAAGLGLFGVALLVLGDVLLGLGVVEATAGPRAERAVGGIVLIATGAAAALALVRGRELERRALLRQQERSGALAQQLRSLFAASPDAVLLLDGAGRVLESNPAAGELAGVERSALLGSPFVTLPFVPAAEREQEQELIEGLGEDELIEREISVRLGLETRTLDLRHRAFAEPGGHRRVLVLVRDVTERRRLERRVESQQRLESLGLLAGGVAHEFNNELSVVVHRLGFALGDPSTGAALRADLEAARAAAERAAEVSSRLLAFGRRQPHDHRPAPVEDSLRRLQAVLASELHPPPRLDLQVEPGLPAVRMSAARLEQSLLSLLLNAAEASEDGGGIRLRASRVDGAADQVRFEVADDGCGMSPEVAARAFEPFFTTRGGSGTGLGLSVVHGFVQQAGGEVRLESEPGRGTVVQLLLPATVEAPERFDLRVEHRASPGLRHVLVVEDQDAVRQALCALLEARGFVVRGARDGLEALDAFREVRTDILVTDVLMPKMGGVELASTLRDRGFSGLVVFVSGFAADALDDAPELGPPWRFLAKPFRAERLLEILNEGSEAEPTQPVAEPAPGRGATLSAGGPSRSP